jgi:acyl-CoA thioesterase
MDSKEFIHRDKLALLLGMELLEAANGCAKAKMAIREDHLNGVGFAHGGIIFSLGDFALAAAANSHGHLALTINSSISFIKAVRKDIIFATATETSKNKNLATYTVTVTDEQGELIAIMQGMVYRKKELY